MNQRRVLACVSAVAMALLGVTEGLHSQAAQTPPARPAWAWTPPIPTGNDGQLHLVPVRGRVHMLIGAGGNITVQAGDEGVLLVDAGAASMTDKVLAAVRTISRRPLRYIINTSERDEFTGGNDHLALAGSTVRFRISTDPRVSDGLGKDRASVISYLTLFERMSAPTGQVAARSEDAWPDNTYSTPQKKLYFNDERILIRHEPSNTDGNSVVHFRTDDVLSVGDLVDLTGYPFIDVKAGGSIQAIVESLNHVIDITVPNKKSEAGTLVIPGHGRLADQPELAYYREMVAIVRDRIQDMIKRGMTLEQVRAARPTRDYDPRFGKEAGPWTTDMFVEAAYRSLGGK